MKTYQQGIYTFRIHLAVTGFGARDSMWDYFDGKGHAMWIYYVDVSAPGKSDVRMKVEYRDEFSQMFVGRGRPTLKRIANLALHGIADTIGFARLHNRKVCSDRNHANIHVFYRKGKNEFSYEAKALIGNPFGDLIYDGRAPRYTIVAHRFSNVTHAIGRPNFSAR